MFHAVARVKVAGGVKVRRPLLISKMNKVDSLPLPSFGRINPGRACSSSGAGRGLLNTSRTEVSKSWKPVAVKKKNSEEATGTTNFALVWKSSKTKVPFVGKEYMPGMA